MAALNSKKKKTITARALKLDWHGKAERIIIVILQSQKNTSALETLCIDHLNFNESTVHNTSIDESNPSFAN